MRIDQIAAGLPAQNLTKGKTADAAPRLEEPAFGQWLKRSIDEVNKMQKQADTAARKLISGENKDIHGTMIAMQKSGVAMDLMMEVRNKIISAYDEIKRMQF